MIDAPAVAPARSPILRVIDFETTGVHETDAVVEVATVDVIRGPDGLPCIGGRWSSLVNPDRAIPPEASAVHHILNEDIAEAPFFDDLIPQIMADAPMAMVAHFAKFDQMFLNAGDIPWICTYRVALKAWFDAPSHKNQALRYFLRLPVPRDIPPHRAPGDALVTANILIAAMRLGMTATEMVKISREPAVLPRIHFGMHEGKTFEEIPAGYLSWCLKQASMDEDVRHTAFVHLNRRRGQPQASGSPHD